MKRNMFDKAELGLGNHAFSKVEEADPWWREKRRDYSALVRFWCPDLTIRRHLVRGGRHAGGLDLWEVSDPKGKLVAFGTTPNYAWRMTLAMVLFHLKREREKREGGMFKVSEDLRTDDEAAP